MSGVVTYWKADSETNLDSYRHHVHQAHAHSQTSHLIFYRSCGYQKGKTRTQEYIATTLQVTCPISGDTGKSTFTLDLPLDTPFDELNTLIKPIIDPNSAAGVMALLSVAVTRLIVDIHIEKCYIVPSSPIAPIMTIRHSCYNPSTGLKINLHVFDYAKGGGQCTDI